MTSYFSLQHHATLILDCVLAGVSLTQMPLTGHGVLVQLHLMVLAPPQITRADQVIILHYMDTIPFLSRKCACHYHLRNYRDLRFVG